MPAGTGKQLISIFGDGRSVLPLHSSIKVSDVQTVAVIVCATITGVNRQKKRQVTVNIKVIVKAKNCMVLQEII